MLTHSGSRTQLSSVLKDDYYMSENKSVPAAHDNLFYGFNHCCYDRAAENHLSGAENDFSTHGPSL